jgi:hypothetical protein
LSRKLRKEQEREYIESNWNQEKIVLEEDFETKPTLSQILFNLTSLFSSETPKRLNYEVRETPELWASVMRIVSFFQISEGLAFRMTPILINSFTEASQKIQAYIFPFVASVLRNLNLLSERLLLPFVGAFSQLTTTNS